VAKVLPPRIEVEEVPVAEEGEEGEEGAEEGAEGAPAAEGETAPESGGDQEPAEG
jgi:hypothetical protein